MSALKQIKQRLASLSENTTELNLSKIKIHNFDEDIKKALEKYKKVQILILSNCELASLDHLPAWKLTAIELSQNKLTDNCLTKLSTITSLTQIICVSNRIQSLDSLKPLSALKKLQEVDFTDNPVSLLINYRTFLFDSIKSLQIVDQKDVVGNEVGEEDEFEDDDDEQQYGDQDDQFEGDEEDDEYEEQEQSDKPKKKRK